MPHHYYWFNLCLVLWPSSSFLSCTVEQKVSGDLNKSCTKLLVYPVLTTEEGLFTVQSSEMVGGPGEREIVGCNLLPEMPGKKVKVILRKLDFKCWPRTYGERRGTCRTAESFL